VQVTERIRAVAGEVNLLVVDCDTDRYYRSQRVIISGLMSDVDVIEAPTSNPANSDPVSSADAAAADAAENCEYVVIVVVIGLLLLHVIARGVVCGTVRENVCNNSKKRKKSCFFGF